MGSTEELTARIRRHFARQKTLVEETLAGLPERVGNTEDLERLLVAQEKSVHAMTALREEQALLRREWESATPSAEDRAAIHEEGARLEAQADTVRRRIDALSLEARGLLGEGENLLRRLRRGRNLLGTYRPRDPGETGGSGWSA